MSSQLKEWAFQNNPELEDDNLNEQAYDDELLYRIEQDRCLDAYREEREVFISKLAIRRGDIRKESSKRHLGD